jgi:hypothetical protein
VASIPWWLLVPAGIISILAGAVAVEVVCRYLGGKDVTKR